MAGRVLVDSGFWLALWDTRDQWHAYARPIVPILSSHQLLLPWPTLYETLCTRFVRRTLCLDALLTQLQKDNHHKLDDSKYRDAALAEVKFMAGQGRALSLVDAVLRQMLCDGTLQLKGIITFNMKDFSDICSPRRIMFYPDSNF